MSQHSAQWHVYEAAKSIRELRCGDKVEVEWEGSWYAGTISDIPKADTFAVVYTTGDFEEEVPRSAVRRKELKPMKKPSGKNKGRLNVRLADAANYADLESVQQTLREGADAKYADEQGYTPLHWASGPGGDVPGDTISRRACIALLVRAVGSVEYKDSSQFKLRPLHHAVSLNLVGCVKTLVYLGASVSGVLHWAVFYRAHAVLRELLALGAKGTAKSSEWDGCTPLQLAVTHFDAYAVTILLEHAARRGMLTLRTMLSEPQAAGLKASVLHHAADKAADNCIELLLRYGADVWARTGKGETPLDVARRAAKSAPAATKEAAERCVQLLQERANEKGQLSRKRRLGVDATEDREVTLGATNGGRSRAEADLVDGESDGSDDDDVDEQSKPGQQTRAVAAESQGVGSVRGAVSQPEDDEDACTGLSGSGVNGHTEGQEEGDCLEGRAIDEAAEAAQAISQHHAEAFDRLPVETPQSALSAEADRELVVLKRNAHTGTAAWNTSLEQEEAPLLSELVEEPGLPASDEELLTDQILSQLPVASDLDNTLELRGVDLSLTAGPGASRGSDTIDWQSFCETDLNQDLM